jgi:hypothetical protein
VVMHERRSLCAATSPTGLRIRGNPISSSPRRSAFRIHKSDLSIRPLWHQQTDRMLARILVCFLAYALMRRRGVPYSSYARMNPS